MFFTARFSRRSLGRIAWWAKRMSVWEARTAMSDYYLELFFVCWRRSRALDSNIFLRAKTCLFAWSMIVEKLMQDITQEKWKQCTSTCKQYYSNIYYIIIKLTTKNLAKRYSLQRTKYMDYVLCCCNMNYFIKGVLRFFLLCFIESWTFI